MEASSLIFVEKRKALNSSGDSCMNEEGVCIRTVEGSVACVTEGQGDGDPCSRSRDCTGKYVILRHMVRCISLAVVSIRTSFLLCSRVCAAVGSGFCVTQVRRFD
jgi:hypothetical protein